MAMTAHNAPTGAILGNKKCPSCGRKFSRLQVAEGPLRRDCPCGSRWTISFESIEASLAARLGGSAVRLVATPYVDGRRRKAPAGAAEQLEFSAGDAEPTEPTRDRRRRQQVVRGTAYRKAKR
jgi:hypothetical protein